MILVIFLSFGHILTSSLYEGLNNTHLCDGASSNSAQAFSLSSAGLWLVTAARSPGMGEVNTNSAWWRTRKYLSAFMIAFGKNWGIRTYCQTLGNVQGEVQAGNGQHSSCPSV